MLVVSLAVPLFHRRRHLLVCRCGQLPYGKRSLLARSTSDKGTSAGAGNKTASRDKPEPGCEDLRAVAAMPVKELHKRLSNTFCVQGEGGVGFAFLGAFLASMDVDGDGDIGARFSKDLPLA